MFLLIFSPPPLPLERSSRLTLIMDARIVNLHRQYLQQLDELSYPTATVLLEPSIQNEISYEFFDSSNGQHLPSLSYQRRVLKNITDRILSAIQDPNEDVCFSFWPVFFVLFVVTSFPVYLSFILVPPDIHLFRKSQTN
jgi:hypothetical protein